MEKITILWADDEISTLGSQISFLKSKGFEIITVSNGHDAIDAVKNTLDIDVVLLDESMPGITGIETLTRLKLLSPHLPIVMITKNDTEHLMEEAIGSQISDYLIKPVSPIQVLTSVRKIVDGQRLIREKTSMDYQQEFRSILMDLNNDMDYDNWVDMYKRIVRWELQLDKSNTPEMQDILAMQKTEANAAFSKFIQKNYVSWFKTPGSGPIMSNQLMRKYVLPELHSGAPVVMLLLDNLRYDQWKIIEPIITERFRVEEENYFYSILPTATQYSRNAIFSGLMPLEIEKQYPNWWKNDSDEGGKNMHEHDLLTEMLKRVVHRPVKHDYVKITNVAQGKQLEDNVLNYLNNELTVIVYNFIDMLSHARTEMEVLKELAGDERAYRNLTLTWFANSPIWAALQKLSERDIQLIVTTDHGTIRVNSPSKVVGDRETTSNLRYKSGRNLSFEKKDVLEIREPKEVGLPSPNMSTWYIFGKEDTFFLYPNNYTHFHNYYKNTFQHGGISLEEMIVPVIKLRSKK